MKFQFNRINVEEWKLGRNTVLEVILFGVPLFSLSLKLTPNEIIGRYVQVTVLGFSLSAVGKELGLK